MASKALRNLGCVTILSRPTGDRRGALYFAVGARVQACVPRARPRPPVVRRQQGATTGHLCDRHRHRRRARRRHRELGSAASPPLVGSLRSRFGPPGTVPGAPEIRISVYPYGEYFFWAQITFLGVRTAKIGRLNRWNRSQRKCDRGINNTRGLSSGTPIARIYN